MSQNIITHKKGFSSNSFTSILATILSLLLIAIAALSVAVNVSTAKMISRMQDFNDYQSTATKLQTGASRLSETASSFIQTPVILDGPEAGNINSWPIQSYAEEMREDRRGQKIAETFIGFDIDDEIKDNVVKAADYAVQMQEVQSHAISLVFSAVKVPESLDLGSIPLIPLTAEEQAMSEGERLAKAKSLINQKDYSLLKSYMNTNIETAHRLIQMRLNSVYIETQQKIMGMRTVLLVLIFTFTLVIVATFVCFYRWIVFPLRRYEKDISADRMLTPTGRVKELFSIVDAYNDLMSRRNRLDQLLRAAAETDSLTGLPNRYSMERNTLDIDWFKGTVTVMLFDLNFLKQINDTYGHYQGDQLIKNAAECINSCFGGSASETCYRFGGDEFAAVLMNVTEEDLKERFSRFEKMLEDKNVSISYGYAHETSMKEGSFKNMWTLADNRMYNMKRKVHDKRFGMPETEDRTDSDANADSGE